MSTLRVNALWGKYVQADRSSPRLYLDSLTEYLEIIVLQGQAGVS
jgi:hypothetical protein